MVQALPYIYAIGAAQAMILAIALWRKKVNTLSNKVLTVWLLFLCFDLTTKAIFLSNGGSERSFFYNLVQFFPFLYGSFFFIYIRSLTSKLNLDIKDLKHFAAFIVYITINVPTLSGLFDLEPIGLKYYELVLYVSSISYVTAGLVLIFRYRKDLALQQVDIKEVDLQWLLIMGCSQIVIWLIAVSQWLIPIQGYNHWTIYIAVSAWIILTGYLSHSLPNIPPITSIKTVTTKINEDRFEQVKQKISALIEDNKIHLQPNLTIGQMAISSGYPEYLISLYINSNYVINFRDFINKLRIENAKKLLYSEKNQTVLDIAYACGYNSKSTFNSAFKKHANQTPSQFRQQQNVT